MGNDGEMWELSMIWPTQPHHHILHPGGVGWGGGWGSNGMIGPRGHIITSYLRMGWGGGGWVGIHAATSSHLTSGRGGVGGRGRGVGGDLME